MSDENFGLSSEARARIRIALATAVINARAKKVNDVDRLSATNDHLIAAGRSRPVLPLSPPSPQDFRLDPRQLGCADEHTALTLSHLAHLALSFHCGNTVAPAELRAARSHMAALVKRLQSLESFTRARKCSGPVARFAGMVTSRGLELGPQACTGVAETLESLASAADGQWAPQVFLGTALVTKLPTNDPVAVVHSLPVVLSSLSVAAGYALPMKSNKSLASPMSDEELDCQEPPAKQPRESAGNVCSYVKSVSSTIHAQSGAEDMDELTAAAWRRMTAAATDLSESLCQFRPARFMLMRLAADLEARRPVLNDIESENCSS